MSQDLRRAGRIVVNAPVVIECVGTEPMQLHPNLAAVYHRVEADADSVGRRFPAVVRDLSSNGAFIAGVALPLLSRVALTFELEGIGTIDAIGWVLWQRSDDCTIPGATGGMIPLPRGFGVLFESIPLETRAKIAAATAR